MPHCGSHCHQLREWLTLYFPWRQAATSNFALPPPPPTAGANSSGAAAPVPTEASRKASKARSDKIAGLVEGLGVALLRDAVAGEAPIAIATPTFKMEAGPSLHRSVKTHTC